jgi:nitric oxide reductase large subunit
MSDLLQSLADVYKPLAFGFAAWGCFLLGTSQGMAQRTPTRLRKLWLLLCPLYLLVAANSLVQGDVLWVQWARSFSRAHDVYEERRFFQLLALAALALLAAKVWQSSQQRQRQHQAPASVLQRMLLTGAAGTLALLLLRFVSFHYTDLVLNAIWLHHSLASWVEGASLGLAGLATGLEILRSYGNV